MDNEKQDTRRKNIVAVTLIMVFFTMVSLLITFILISEAVQERSLGRMEEGIQEVTEEIKSKMDRESRILNATADILSKEETLDQNSILELMGNMSPLLETMQIRVLLPDDTVLVPNGTVADVSDRDELSFDVEAPLGEHVTDRVTSLTNGRQVLRYFVPVIRDGETAALVFGLTELEGLPESLNVTNIYNAAGHVFIVDTRTGDFIMDTTRDSLGNVADFNASSWKTKGKTDWEGFTETMMSLGSGYVVYQPDYSREWRYLYCSPAGVNEWSVALSVPEREAFATVFVVRDICIGLGLILAVAEVLYCMFIRREYDYSQQMERERLRLAGDLKRAEAAEQAKTTFLSNMSHDIRTPMNAIIGFTTLAEANIDNKARVQEYLAKILSSSNHLLSLINDILDMSRIESGKLNIEEKPCSISDIFRDMRNIIQTQMQSKQLNFFMDTMDVVDEEIFCDKLHVNQVLLNLLSNAIKFTPAGGSVSLTVRQLPGAPAGYGSYEIRVKDTGIGMSPEFAQRIFEPFERERTSTVSGIQGTGLGMAIAKSIVDTMGGTIRVETQQGKGTEFILQFTFRLQAESKRVEVIRELSGIRGLVVDDSFSTCDSVTKMLTQIGMRAEWTMHGQEAVLRARQAMEMGDEFRAYIIDWLLPDLSGIEVARQIRGIVGEHVPIIILTAYDWTAIEDEARKAGVTGFVNKPIFLSELRDTLVASFNSTDPRMPAPAFSSKPVADLRGTRLLLVEDNELNREIAQELLEESGFQVESAENGSVAVNMVAGSQPGYYALVLMDVQMPVMNGYEASRAIRGLPDPQLSSIPIVAMTANAFEEDRRQALACGMNDHVAKPINVEKLLQVLAVQLKGKMPETE